MTPVTRADQTKVLALLVPGISARREEMLLSLAAQTTWTTGQRQLVERMWAERQRAVTG